MIVVKVGNHKKKTSVRDRTDCPFYNEYFVFTFTCELEELMRTRITISAYLRNRLRRLKFHGGIHFEAGTMLTLPSGMRNRKQRPLELVYPDEMLSGTVPSSGDTEPDVHHEYYHKWAMLMNPKDQSGGPKGYVKCNVTIVTKGEKIKAHPETDDDEDIEGNLLLPIVDPSISTRQRARYVFSVYRVDGLPTVEKSIACTGNVNYVKPYIEISFAGMKKSLWDTEEYILVGIIFDACMIDRSRYKTKPIHFEMSLGNSGNRMYPHSQCVENDDGLFDESISEQRSVFESQTSPRSTGSTDGKYNYIPLESNKPCVFVKSWWPNLEWRVTNTNSLRFIANFLEKELEKLEGFIVVQNRATFTAYNEIITSLKNYCTHYLHILDTGRYDDEGGTTKLDRHRVNLCRENIEAVLKMIKVNGYLQNNHYIKIAMVHAYKYLHRIRELCDDDENEREMQDYSACKLEIFMWLGNAKFANACWSSIPSGYEVDHHSSLDVFPRVFTYTENWKFQLRAHIFQGRFDPGMDSSGLMDPFLRVIFRGYTSTTETIKESLDPFWDQTLIFPPIELHGTRENIKELPPKVVIEAFDLDMCDTKEFFGRCIVTPVVKLTTETYTAPEFPPRLEWHKFQSQKDYSGSVLAAFELIEIGENDLVDFPSVNTSTEGKIYNLPDDIRPAMRSHRMEVIFWGVRDMRKINYVPVTKPRVVLECSGVHVKSEVMENAKKFSNFEENHIIVDLDMPELDVYFPSVVIKVYDSRGFGCFKYVGVCVVPTAHAFLQKLITDEEYESTIYERNLPLPNEYDPESEESKGLISYKRLGSVDSRSRLTKLFGKFKETMRNFKSFRKKKKKEEYAHGEDESHDWWTRYFASLEIYPMELEMQPEFDGFNDRLTTFELWRGKRTGDPDADDKNFSGRFKGHIAIYRWPHPEHFRCKTKTGRNVADGLCDDYPSQEPLKVIVRLYVVKATNLQPTDPLSGKSDPYLRIKLGKSDINDKKHYIPNQLNPVFGKLFELDAQFPKDHMLTIQVWDYDIASSDDLIGETKIDIENRFYSTHRAHCGIAKTYNSSGYNAWRDRERPTQILGYLCNKNNLPLPEYLEDCVKIGKQRFPFEASIGICSDEEGSAHDRSKFSERDECMALNVLHQWQQFPICGTALVPEHVERRPLFNASRPGLEQGKLELWIDMFNIDELPPKLPIDITPQVPEDYEIRVIIWNVEDVPLVDNQFLTGEKCSDIYIKGWILYEDHQKTDVHYNSLNGEGNFNWRFIFRVTYARGENLMIVRKKLSVLAKDHTEQKMPCKLNLQVWDSDHFSPDDFLGSLTMDLSRMPKGSANSKNCTLKVIHPKSPTVNLFKVMRTKAWWPFACVTSTGKEVQAVRKMLVDKTDLLLVRYKNLCVSLLTTSKSEKFYSHVLRAAIRFFFDDLGPLKETWVGKVEMEMIVVPASQAKEHPVGKGRNSPEPLEPPKRPDTSFSWFRNPWKACCFVVCRYYRWRIFCCCFMFLLVMLVGCAIYAFPGYFVKRLLGA
ncbi:otoferlin-like [Venturia canescens]|uniref:otoferlin-like n=1 Tax=Venturia canescens TaxID=32260 RepID=UPI001C9BDE52|nr:otoferlin-like [Venturia canescens]